jgi:hypothetical protein
MSQLAALRMVMSTVPEIERRLREWGLAYGQRVTSEAPEPDAETPLHRASVDRSREGQAVEQPAGGFARTGVQRRRLRESLGPRVHVPSWAGSETVRCTESRTPGATWHPPAPAQAVEEAVLALYRFDQRAALALRARYCLLGRRPQSERIAWVAWWSSTKVTRLGYRAAVARGRDHVAATLKIVG